MFRDPYILLSYINTKLRNSACDLCALCRELDEDRDRIEETLRSIGYAYDETSNRFVPV